MRHMPTREQILEALRVVIDPELRQDIVTLGMVRSITVSDGGVVDVTVSLTTPGCPIRSHFQTSVVSAARSVEGVSGVNVAFDVLSDQEKAGLQQKLGRQVKPAEITDILQRLKALDSQRGKLPVPKGPVPTSMKGMRSQQRGR